MRTAFTAFCLPLVLIACSANDSGGNTSDFIPPVNILRADLVAGFARNFARLDRNGDGAIEAGEVPKRPAMFRRLDVDHDGKITLDELRAGQLAHFDQADANHDGTLTSAERRAAKGWKESKSGEAAE